MISPTRRSLARPALALVALVLASLLVLAPSAAAEGTEGATVINYEKETLAQFEGQLAAREIKAVTINRRLRSLRTTLTDGRHVLARYKAKGGPGLRAALTAKHVPVTLLSTTQAENELKKAPVHHKLRYIAGAAVIVVIALVGGVLFYRRRKRALEE